MYAQQVVDSLPSRPPRDDDWRDAAACAEEGQPDRWVDLPPIRVRGKNNPDYDTHIAELRQTCNTCPVRNHCLWESLDMNVRGIFAGMDEFDRADLRDELGLPTPPMMPPPENDEDARLIEQQFAALRLARKGHSNTAIAVALNVSPMTVSRLTANEERPAERRTKHPHPDDNLDALDIAEGTLDLVEDTFSLDDDAVDAVEHIFNTTTDLFDFFSDANNPASVDDFTNA